MITTDDANGKAEAFKQRGWVRYSEGKNMAAVYFTIIPCETLQKPESIKLHFCNIFCCAKEMMQREPCSFIIAVIKVVISFVVNV